VFTVVLNNSETVPTDLEGSPKIFYGRVRSFDNSGNEGEWTSLAASQPTLIDSAEISNLTASKIKAGTITSSIINLDGVNSVIRSSNYVSNSTGWAIKGDGTAEFGAASIRGSLKAASLFIDSNNRWKSTSIGGDSVDPVFKVGSSNSYISWDGTSLGVLEVKGTLKLVDGTDAINSNTANTLANTAANTSVTNLRSDIYTNGFLGGLTINSTQMYYGAGSFR